MNRRHGKHRAGERAGERGFTLIETAIALVIMMIVGLGAASLFFFAAQNNIGANDRDLAMAVAQKRMEWLRSINFNETSRTSPTPARTAGSRRRPTPWSRRRPAAAAPTR